MQYAFNLYIFRLNFISDRILIEKTHATMSSKKRSKSAPPSRSRQKLEGQYSNVEDEPRYGNPSSDFEEEEESGKGPRRGREDVEGFRWYKLRLSLYRKYRIDNMKKKTLEQQEEIQGLLDENEVKI